MKLQACRTRGGWKKRRRLTLYLGRLPWAVRPVWQEELLARLRNAIHSLRCPGSKNKQGFSFTHTAFTLRVMRLLVSVRQVWSWPLLAPDATWLGLTGCARGVVGTRQASDCGLALTAEVSMLAMRRRANDDLPRLTLIAHQLATRFRNGRLMLALLWTPSPGMIKVPCWEIESN